ncbi:hypothetical protein [Lentzea sp. CA-135723]|uniref:hypothetical protein n=1 Tax=Lentzea sp. CA-135723 TaxID=3239950 RepID=UPI003D8CD1E5
MPQALRGIDTSGEAWATYRGRHDISVGDASVRWAIVKLGGNTRLTARWEDTVAALARACPVGARRSARRNPFVAGIARHALGQLLGDRR